MEEFPQTLTIVVNTPEEKEAALAKGFEATRLEFPKMVYLHPVDVTKGHTFAVVDNQEEQDAKLSEGYSREPHVPVDPDTHQPVMDESKA